MFLLPRRLSNDLELSSTIEPCCHRLSGPHVAEELCLVTYFENPSACIFREGNEDENEIFISTQ